MAPIERPRGCLKSEAVFFLKDCIGELSAIVFSLFLHRPFPNVDQSGIHNNRIDCYRTGSEQGITATLLIINILEDKTHND